MGLTDVDSGLDNHPFHKLHDEAACLRAAAEKLMADTPGGNEPITTTVAQDGLGNGPPVGSAANGHGVDGELSRLRTFITRQAKIVTASLMAHEWDTYRKDRLNGSTSPTPKIQALVEEWGDQSWAFYKKLDRANATMLLQCRTGYIGLGYNLFKMGLVWKAPNTSAIGNRY